MTRTDLRRSVGRLPALALCTLLALTSACASTGAGDTGQQPSTTGGTTGAAGTVTTENAPWPLKTREHVDLWLHGFGMLMDDTARVPWFRRGYRDQMVVLKNRANVTTMLDANRDRLRARLALKPELGTQGQFIAIYFGSWQELSQAVSVFLQANGDPNRASDQQTAAVIAFLGAQFTSVADRDWLRLFVQSLEDEAQKYYHSYWLNEQRARGPVLAALDSSWQRVHRPRIQSFLNNSRQSNGTILLSLPLGGEGRSITQSNRENYSAVLFPERVQDANDAIYGFVHEASQQIASAAVADNVTPSERRAGLADRMQGAAAVRAGYAVLARLDPSLASGYADFYLRAANATRTGSTAEAQLAAAFPLPTAVAEALARQLDVVLGGI